MPLSESAGLEALMIDENPLDNDDLTVLSGLRSFDRLWIGGTLIDDVSALAPLDSLTYLSFYGSDVKSVKGCEQLRSLNSLEMGSSGIGDISFLQGIPNLEHVGLSSEVTDISILNGLPNLDTVSFGNAPESMWDEIRALEDKGVSIHGVPFEYYD
jgi:Leucine-rich repeat (LRR) protein